MDFAGWSSLSSGKYTNATEICPGLTRSIGSQQVPVYTRFLASSSSQNSQVELRVVD
jgi:hypothetical protein